MSGTPAPVWTDCSCHTFANPSTMKLMPSVTISGWTLKTPTPIPLMRPASAAAVSATAIPSGTPPGEWMRVAVTKPTIDATAPTDRSMPPVSIVRVWQPARIASGTAVRRITPAHDGRDDARRGDGHHDHEQHQQPGQRDDGAIAEQPPDRVEARRLAGGGGGAHPPLLRSSITLPTMTTPIRIAPCATSGEVRVDLEERQVGLDQLEDHDRDDRAEDAAASAREADAAEDDGGDAEQRVGARHRRPDARARGEREAGEGREQAGQDVGEDLRAADRHAAPEGRQPVAPDRVDGEADPRPPDRDPDDGDDDDQDDERPWDPLVARATRRRDP